MALDRSGALLSASYEDIVGAGLLHEGIYTVDKGLALFATSGVDLSALPREEFHGSPYLALERRGVLALDASGADGADAIMLSGGSVCTTRLERSEDRWVVTKQLVRGRGGFDTVDTSTRHRAEADWLVARADYGSDPFPTSRLLRQGTRLAWEMEFVPRYTLGERMFQGRETATSSASVLLDAFELLAAKVYGPRLGAVQTSYLDIVTRRFRQLRPLDSVYAALWAAGGSVNGRLCAPIATLLETARGSLPQIASPRGGRACHGDLIFEDILPPGAIPGDHGIRLVDPNPLNATPLVDIAKVLMNIVTCYDLVYRDGNVLAVTPSGAGAVADIRSSYDPKSRHYVNMCREVGGALLGELPRISALMDTELNPRTVLVQAALHALALPMFHEAHHGAHARARTFAAIGASLLDHSLAGGDLEEWFDGFWGPLQGTTRVHT